MGNLASDFAADENGDPPHGFHLVRLLTFLPGEIFVNVPYTPNLLHQAGRHIANIEKALIVSVANFLEVLVPFARSYATSKQTRFSASAVERHIT